MTILRSQQPPPMTSDSILPSRQDDRLMLLRGRTRIVGIGPFYVDRRGSRSIPFSRTVSRSTTKQFYWVHDYRLATYFDLMSDITTDQALVPTRGLDEEVESSSRI